ncbi:MAG: DUF5069 domain-containing protein [Verrucomicrobiae bacterium]|nr:DUF5069 domain-containing protein [Verrucomicrobiae bacterium]
MAKIVPLISSGTAGPLGVLHLPRLWLKVSLEARGKLAEGYPGIGQGYDMMVCNALGLNPDAVKKFITDSKPTYAQFEAWIKQQPGVKLDKATIHKLNVAIQGYIHDDQTRKNILGANGLPDDGSTCPDAINLNNLDDWYEFHQAELK